MAEPSKKSAAIEGLLEDVYGRTTAIRTDKCIDPPIGCGQLCEGTFRNPLEVKEYSISGLCGDCQRKIFG